MAQVSSLSASPAPIFRQYTHDNSFSEFFPCDMAAREYQVSLVFAKDDYDQGYSNGLFLLRWNTDPSAIAAFKGKFPTAKVFISIGSLDSTYPFNPKNTEEWIQNAISSLTSIIQNRDHHWLVDGIDIYYKYIKTSPEVFSRCVGKVIKGLKDNNVIALASISPSAAVRNHYEHLFMDYVNYIDWVYYQFQYENNVVPTPEELVGLYYAMVGVFPIDKLFAGYSAANDAWGNVAPVVFLKAAWTLLHAEHPMPGASMYYHRFGN